MVNCVDNFNVLYYNCTTTRKTNIMNSKVEEKLERISYLESEGYSQDVIEAIEDFIEHPDEDVHTFNTLEEMWEWLHED